MCPKLLSVDDDKTVRMLVRAAFYPYACKILEAADGAQGLTIAERERPDLILLDVEMPTMDGVTMLAKLREDPLLRGIPVIMLTSESTRESVVRIAKLGVRDYVVKPFRPDVIVERVRRLVDLKTREELSRAQGRRFDSPLEVLAVDDEPAIIKQIEAGIAGTPWKIHGVTQPAEVMDYASRVKFDVALVSLSMQDDFGFTLLGLLRSSPSTKDVPVLALSVKTAVAEQAQARNAGFAGVVNKPVDPEEMQEEIARTLNLDLSSKYFQRRGELLVLVVPSRFSLPVAKDISTHVRSKLEEAINAGLNRLIIDLSQPQVADLTLVKMALRVVHLCAEMNVRYALLGSPAVRQACVNHVQTKDWQFADSFEEAAAALAESNSLASA